VYGKIKTVTKADGTIINYTYDAAGNRISKIVNGKQTWYVRDASGNVMSVYAVGDTINAGALTQIESELYGSSRLGLFKPNINLQSPPSLDSTYLPGTSNKWGINIIFTRGKKFFELNNQLGNVLATVSDRKIGTDGNNDGIVNYYTADVVSAQDYYPFGMQEPGRAYSSGLYRYGFTGHEKMDEIYGSGNEYDMGARMYDPRIGRTPSIDPKANLYPGVSPYVYALNTPIQAKDPDGNLVIFINGFWGWGTGATGGGNKEYWSYSGGHGDWADAAMKRIGDFHARYYRQVFDLLGMQLNLHCIQFQNLLTPFDN
jgi:RHS repeat-associated protein